jgi:hypothetical protein
MNLSPFLKNSSRKGNKIKKMKKIGQEVPFLNFRDNPNFKNLKVQWSERVLIKLNN